MSDSSVRHPLFCVVRHAKEAPLAAGEADLTPGKTVPARFGFLANAQRKTA
jgi:hypothetical protein